MKARRLAGARPADAALSPDVQALLRRIESYEQLEVLLLLRRHAHQPWSAHSVASELNLRELAAEEACFLLGTRRMLCVASSDRGRLYKYAPVDPELDAALAQLAAAYAEQPLDVVRAMTANAFDRLRKKSLRIFTGAFLSRKRPR